MCAEELADVDHLAGGGGERLLLPAAVAAAYAALDLRAQPRRTRIAAEAKQSLAALTDLVEAAQRLQQVVPEVTFELVVTISA